MNRQDLRIPYPKFTSAPAPRVNLPRVVKRASFDARPFLATLALILALASYL